MLANFLQSVLAQSHSDYEVVIKDGSVERPAIADWGIRALFEDLGPRLRYTITMDNGIFHGANQALQAATGDILYIGNDDDELADAGVLSFVNERFEGKTGPHWIYGKGELIGKDGQFIAPSHKKLTSLEEMKKHNCLFQPSVFWNRALLERGGVFDERWLHASDYELWLRYWKVVEPVFVDRVLGRYRMWSEANSTRFSAAQAQEAHLIAQGA